MNENEPITPFQSSTIKAAVSAIIINAVTLIAIITGKTFDISIIQSAVDYGVPMAINAWSIWYGYKAIKGRLNATQVIEKKVK